MFFLYIVLVTDSETHLQMKNESHLSCVDVAMWYPV